VFSWILVALAAWLAALPATLAGAFAGALAVDWLERWLQHWQRDWPASLIIFASTFFSHRVEGTLATTSLARTLRSSSGVRTCCGSAVSGASFFDLSSGDADFCIETSDHWEIFEVI
jgi:hypothetical protein